MKTKLRSNLLKAVVCVALSLMSCSSADGANGTKGSVRFSQIFNYQETSGFDAKFAAGSTTMVKIQRPAQGTQVEPPGGFPELTLSVRPVGHDGTATVLPLGFAQFAISMNEPGVWELVAKDGTAELDTLDLTVAAADHLRFSPTISVTTTGSSCSRKESGELDKLTLHRNQVVSLYAVAVDADGKSMFGLLPLTAHVAEKEVTIDVPSLLEDGSPNGVILEPTAALSGKPLSLNIGSTAAPAFTLEIPTSTDDAVVSCK